MKESKFLNLIDWIDDNIFFWFEYITEWINYGKTTTRITLDTIRDLRSRFPDRPLNLEAKKAEREKRRSRRDPIRTSEVRHERTDDQPMDRGQRVRDERVEQSSL